MNWKLVTRIALFANTSTIALIFLFTAPLIFDGKIELIQTSAISALAVSAMTLFLFTFAPVVFYLRAKLLKKHPSRYSAPRFLYFTAIIPMVFAVSAAQAEANDHFFGTLSLPMVIISILSMFMLAGIQFLDFLDFIGKGKTSEQIDPQALPRL